MLSAVVLLLANALFARGAQLQAILLDGWVLRPVNMSEAAVRYGPNVPMMHAAALCAEEAIYGRTSAFQILTTYRWNNPRFARNRLHFDDPEFASEQYRIRTEMETLNSVCKTYHSPVEALARQPLSTVNVGKMRSNVAQVFECYNSNCTNGDELHDLPQGVMRKHLAEHPMSAPIELYKSYPSITVEGCKALLARHNILRAVGQPALNYGTLQPRNYYRNQTELVEGSLCQGWEETEWPFYVKVTTKIGLLSPPVVDAQRNIIRSGEHFTEVSCTEKDLPVNLTGNACQHFTYNFPEGHDVQFGANPRQLNPEQLRLPDGYRATHQGSLQSTSLTYRKIAQTSNQVFSSETRNNHRMHPYTKIMEAYSAEDALKECAEASVSRLHHTFELALTGRGWRCASAFTFLTDASLLSQTDNTILQSYMYSADYTSQNDLDA